MTWPEWESQLLEAMGITPTPQRVTFLAAWAACEGGHAAFNPLNTTWRVAGATPYNHAGVMHYTDSMMGLAATMLTLRLPYYAHLRTALRTKDLRASAILAAGRSDVAKWGTNPDCLAAKLRGK